MPPVNPSKAAVENTDDVDELRNIELQTAFLFDEFLRIYHPADIFDDERWDSPVPAPQSYKAKGLDQGGSIIVQEVGDVKYGSQTFPIQDKRIESDFVAQGPVPKTAASIDADKAKELSKLAAKLQEAGDQLIDQYGSQMKEIENNLVTFVRKQGTQLTYDALANMIQHEVEQGTDINFTTFIMTFHLSKTVWRKAGGVCVVYFKEYVKQRYLNKMQQSGGVERFTLSNRREMPQ